MADRADRPGEFELIDRYFRPLATAPGAFRLRDDAALLQPPPGDDLVVTADLVVAGVHFLPDDPPRSVAMKALRVNLSDLAAKGAEAIGYLLTIGLPPDWEEAWVAGFAGGLADDQKRYGVSLLGGDTSRAAAITLSVTAIGRLPAGSMIRRASARPGDVVVVSGTIGDAALGLRIRLGSIDARLAGDLAHHLLDRYLHPQPRTCLAAAVRRYASSAVDVSDGLVGDLAHICEASGVTAEIDSARVPLSAAAGRLVADDPTALSTVLNGGDDYEILASVPPNLAEAFIAESTAAGVPLAAIGRIRPGSGPPVVIGADGRTVRLTRSSHTHFRPAGAPAIAL